jgi:hypothetical protein
MTAEDTICATCHEHEGEMVCESSACGQPICTRCWMVSDYGQAASRLRLTPGRRWPAGRSSARPALLRSTRCDRDRAPVWHRGGVGDHRVLDLLRTRVDSRARTPSLKVE